MIIFGTRGVTTTANSGVFDCPQCAGNMNYSHKKVTRFFTLYFIPLIPLGKAGEYVECQTCKNTFVTRVLQANSGLNIISNFESAVKSTMIMIMLADGKIDESEKKAVLEIINQNVRFKLNEFQLENEIKKIQKDNLLFDQHLKLVSSTLNDEGKENLISCAYKVAAADGHVEDSELQQIKKMAKLLGVSDIHYEALMQNIRNN